MPHSPLSRYRQMVDYCEITHDPAQETIVQMLQALYEKLEMHAQQHSAPTKAWSRLWRISTKETASISSAGLYIWGGVGRGKSMLMDMFYHSLSELKKQRIHFHRFMLEVHEAIHHYRVQGVDDPLMRVAQDISKRYKILCFDELQVHDITDAMLLARLFTHLFEQKLTIIFTSNRPPEDLYANGLQRERFLPFIALIREQLQVVEIISARDYRQDRLAGLKEWYLCPCTPDNARTLAQEFDYMAGHELATPQHITVQGRSLLVPRACRDMAWFHFDDLCDQPLSSHDYLELATVFRFFFIEAIPVMTPDMRNQAKRFVHLIDVLYEARALLFCTADALPEALYDAGDGAFEFERTASRLREMMSADYIAQEYRAL
ncbi:MAG: cell division protein ZapE [Sphaerospermopsis sp. SIO1G2]|nr:cell division protein ZapE [Sphaerospermopsis sp. SIO1G2]